MALRKVRLLIVLSMVLPCIVVHATERQNNADYRARRVALAKLMEGGSLVLFAPTEAEGQNNLYGFRQDDNFYYLTGWSEPGAAVLINSNPYTEIFFLAEHNLTQEKWTGQNWVRKIPRPLRRPALTRWRAWTNSTPNC